MQVQDYLGLLETTVQVFARDQLGSINNLYWDSVLVHQFGDDPPAPRRRRTKEYDTVIRAVGYSPMPRAN